MLACLALGSPVAGQTVAGARVDVIADAVCEPYAQSIADICDFAVAQAEAKGLTLPPRLLVRAEQNPDHWPSFIADLDGQVVVCPWHEDTLATIGGHPGDVDLHQPRQLMGAVLDVATDNLLPGVTLMLACDELVPALWAEKGAAAWPGGLDYLELCGPEAYERIAAYARGMPVLEIGAWARKAGAELGGEAIWEALAAVPEQVAAGAEPMRAFGEAVLARAAGDGLRQEFDAIMAVVDAIDTGEGDLVFGGFEEGHPPPMWEYHSANALLTQEHATEGARCAGLRPKADLTGPVPLAPSGIYWWHPDWSAFSALAMDIYNDSAIRERVVVQLWDEHYRTHANALLELSLPPKCTTALTLRFDRLPLRPMPGFEDRFDGTLHLQDMGWLEIAYYPSEAKPTIYVDNVRLVR
jgi:hypothetical protein